MIRLRSTLFSVLFFIWGTTTLVICLPLLVLPGRYTLVAGRLWTRGVMGLLAGVCGLRYEVRGLENIPAVPCIIASKHQSAWDTFVFPLLVPRISYVFKRELTRIPLFGWYLKRAGYIPIDRAGGAQALREMVRCARERLEQGYSIVIFPEGTRVAPGQRRAYHPGTPALYSRLGVPVVPVALNSGLFWGRDDPLKRPGVIVLEFLPPIAPGLPRKAFAAQLERTIEAASQRLLDEAGGAPGAGPGREAPPRDRQVL